MTTMKLLELKEKGADYWRKVFVERSQEDVLAEVGRINKPHLEGHLAVWQGMAVLTNNGRDEEPQ